MRGVLSLGREVIRRWHEEHYEELAADVADPHTSNREDEGFTPIVWLPGQQLLRDGPDRGKATPS